MPVLTYSLNVSAILVTIRILLPKPLGYTQCYVQVATVSGDEGTEIS